MKSDQGANPQKNEICHFGIEIKNVKPNTTVPFTFFNFFPIAIADLIPWYTWHQENGPSFMETCERVNSQRRASIDSFPHTPGLVTSDGSHHRGLEKRV